MEFTEIQHERYKFMCKCLDCNYIGFTYNKYQIHCCTCNQKFDYCLFHCCKCGCTYCSRFHCCICLKYEFECICKK